VRLDHLLSKEHICPQGTDSYRVECWLVGYVVIPLGELSPKYLYFALSLSGDCRVGPDSRLPFWRSEMLLERCPFLGLSFHDDPHSRRLAVELSVVALIFENSRTSTSIYISKNINFSKLQRVNGGCLGV